MNWQKKKLPTPMNLQWPTCAKRQNLEEAFTSRILQTLHYKEDINTKKGIRTVIVDSLEEKWGLNLLREGSLILRIMARKPAETWEQRIRQKFLIKHRINVCVCIYKEWRKGGISCNGRLSNIFQVEGKRGSWDSANGFTVWQLKFPVYRGCFCHFVHEP